MKKSIWEDSYSHLRNELRKIRKDSGLTQIQLAKLLNQHQSYVSKYEIGDRNLDFIEVIRICLACKVEPEKFTSEITANYLKKNN